MMGRKMSSREKKLRISVMAICQQKRRTISMGTMEATKKATMLVSEVKSTLGPARHMVWYMKSGGDLCTLTCAE